MQLSSVNAAYKAAANISRNKGLQHENKWVRQLSMKIKVTTRYMLSSGRARPEGPLLVHGRHTTPPSCHLPPPTPSVSPLATHIPGATMPSAWRCRT